MSTTFLTIHVFTTEAQRLQRYTEQTIIVVVSVYLCALCASVVNRNLAHILTLVADARRS